MSENGSDGTDNGLLDKFKELLLIPNSETYSFDRIWNQRKKIGAKPLLTDLVGPTQENVCLGLREYRKYFGLDYYLLGLFLKNGDVYDPVGYLLAEGSVRGRPLVSQTIDSGQLKEFNHDPVFSPLINSIRGGMTFVVEDDFQNFGLGTKLVKTMLEISEKIGAHELIFGDLISGYVDKIANTLAKERYFGYGAAERNGSIYLKRKV